MQGNRHPNRNLISLSFATLPELPRRYPEIAEHLVVGPESGGSIREMSRPLTLWKDWASIYCASIKQRERKYFRQLIFCSQDLRASLRGSTCLHDNSSCCQNHTSPNQLSVCSCSVDSFGCQAQRTDCKNTAIFLTPQGDCEKSGSNKAGFWKHLILALAFIDPWSYVIPALGGAVAGNL